MRSATTGLTGTQKAAIILMQLEPAQASNVLKQFTEFEAEEITSEIVRLRRVDPEVAGAGHRRVPRA